MIRKSYFLLSLLQAVLSEEWKGETPREVTAQEGLCAQIPCHYSYPSRLANRPRVGIWFNNVKWSSWSIAFHSKDHNRESSQFRHRTRLSGDLRDGDCSLIINNITQRDAGPYYFRIEFNNSDRWSYGPVTQLHVSDFTDKPRIFPAEMIAGKRVNVSCTFNTTCNGTAPVLTWVNSTDIPGSVSNSATQHGVTLTYTSVLSLIPSLKHHGQTLTSRVRYPSVSSEQTLALTVQSGDGNEWRVGLLAAGITLSVALAGFAIFACVRKRKAATEERASEPSDIAMTSSPLSAKHQGSQCGTVPDSWNVTSDATSEAETPAPRGLSEGRAGGDAGHGQPAKHEDLLYASINFLKLPNVDGTVDKDEGTEYAEIRFQ